METIKIWDIPNEIPELTHDGDKEDLRLHFGSENYAFGAENEKEYDEVEKKIFDFEIVRENYTVYLSCDSSGYEYWIVQQEECNFITIAVMFETNELPISDLAQLGNDLLDALNYAENIEYNHPFDEDN